MLRPLSYRLETGDGRTVGVRDGRLADPHGHFPLTIPVGLGELRPGLINAHDHLHRNHYPRLGSPPYPDAYAWGRDLHDRWGAEIERLRALDRRTALLFGALKNLLGGATTVVHHDRWEALFDADFPVRVAPIRSAHSLRLESELAAALADPAAGTACIHLAEGTTAEAADEVRELDRLGGLGPELLAVHAVGPDADGVRRLRDSGAAVVWCPTSNLFLFGRTSPPELLAPGIDVLLGTDALLTGEGTLLDELRAASRLGALAGGRLMAAVGATAARRLRLPEPSLATGAAADLVLFERPPLEAGPADLGLVVVDGLPRLGAERLAELFEHAGVVVERVAIGGSVKLVAAPLAQAAREVAALSPECARILA